MKLCYCDESGTSEEPFAVMAGVIVDCQRMHKTKFDWNKLLDSLSRIIHKRVIEIHTRDFYPVNGFWKGIDGKQRAETITAVLKRLQDRKHDVIFTVINKELHKQEKSIGKIPTEIETVWRSLGFHLILGI